MIQRQHQRKTRNRKFSAGFTMVEVVVAGVLLMGAMTAVAQIGATALAGSKTRSSRADVEAAVSNNIQLLQQADSYLTYEDIGSAEKQELACSNPTSYLISHLEEAVPVDQLKTHLRSILNNSDFSKLQFEREMKAVDGGDTQDVVQVTYRFQGPESGVEQEIRTVELNPNFSAHCYTTS